MRELPILFSAPMVLAILEGRKTVTRRVVRDQPSDQWSPASYGDIHKMRDGGFLLRNGAPVTIGWGPCNADGDEGYLSPYGQPGDRLWVREAWRVPAGLDDLSGMQIADKCLDVGYRAPWCPIQYEADGARNSEKDWREFGAHPAAAMPGRYRHARFMPRWASRITLEVTGVRVERLQDITETDAISEGIRELPMQERQPGAWWCADPLGNTTLHCRSPRAAFARLWESINGADSWNANPWVWAVEFKRVLP